MIPEIPENISIDDNNNIIVSMHYKIEEIWNKESLEVCVNENKYLIKRDELLLKDFQTKVLRYKGISRINTKNIYHINNKSDIIIQIYLDL